MGGEGKGIEGKGGGPRKKTVDAESDRWTRQRANMRLHCAPCRHGSKQNAGQTRGLKNEDSRPDAPNVKHQGLRQSGARSGLANQWRHPAALGTRRHGHRECRKSQAFKNRTSKPAPHAQMCQPRPHSLSIWPDCTTVAGAGGSSWTGPRPFSPNQRAS